MVPEVDSALFGVSFFSVLSDGVPLSDELAALPDDAPRLSLMYQPDPLNTIAGFERSRRGGLPQLGHAVSASSLKDWTALKAWPQWSQR